MLTAFHNLPRGAVITSYGDFQPHGLFERLATPLALSGIRRHQRRLWPKSDKTDAIHAIIKRSEHCDGGGSWVSCESPRVREFTLEHTLDPLRKWRAYQYAGSVHFTEAGWKAFDDYLARLIGTPYDYGQLLDIGVGALLGWHARRLSLFDLGRKRKVCSVLCAGALHAAWQFSPREYPRPSGTFNVENVCPAYFENSILFKPIAQALPL